MLMPGRTGIEGRRRRGRCAVACRPARDRLCRHNDRGRAQVDLPRVGPKTIIQDQLRGTGPINMLGVKGKSVRMQRSTNQRVHASLDALVCGVVRC